MKRVAFFLFRLFCTASAALVLYGCGENAGSGPPVLDLTVIPPSTPAVLPTLADEKAAFKPSLDSLKAALASKDAAAAASTFAPEAQSEYKVLFENHAEAFFKIVDALAAGTLTLVGDHEVKALDGTTRRIGDMAVTYDGITFHVTVVKINGVWKFKTL